MSSSTGKQCDCDQIQEPTRRDFLKRSAALGVAATGIASGLPAVAKEGKPATSETLVQQLYTTLNDEQRAAIAFPFDHQLRSKVDNNWHITKTQLQRDFSKEQQALVREIFNGLHSEEYAAKVYDQVEHDGGFGKSSIALFGEPGSGKFEFVLTGRHCTRRCDGDSVAGKAFGGPIFYGHAAQGFVEPPDHPGNAYWYQALQANKLFQALDAKQREAALLNLGRDEKGTSTVALKGVSGNIEGLPVSEMSDDQKALARKVMADVLAPFRKVDRIESMKLIEKNGFDNLRFSYFKKMDVGNDGVWDVWQVEGPAMVWYFRGRPHVHTWVHIAESATG